jgi:hypothetical protein
VTALQIVLAVLCGITAIVVLVQIVRDRPPGTPVDVLLAVIEVGLVVQLALGIVRVAHGHDRVSVVTYVGYLVAALVVLPVAWLWSAGERSRGGSAVLLVGLLVVPFLFVRLAQVWSTHALH